MGYLVNNLSLHGQFPDMDSFGRSVREIMAIRSLVISSGLSVYCHRQMLLCNVATDIPLSKAVNCLTHDEKRAFLLWIIQHGPFWDEARCHNSDDWLEAKLDIVTDSAVAEAAFFNLRGINRSLISFSPSDWNYSPIDVNHISDEGESKKTSILNYWEKQQIENALKENPVRIDSWQLLGDAVQAQCSNLTFTDETFAPLTGHPFSENAAVRILFICNTLNKLKACFNEEGQRTAEGHEIYQNFFTGKKENGGRGALFSDSSDSEKKEFSDEMTFRIPGLENKAIFCPWHGKVQTPQFRVHFSWPMRHDEKTYIMYVGPKITKS